MQVSVEELFNSQRVDETPVQTGSRQNLVGVSSTLHTHSVECPGPSKPLGHVGSVVRLVVFRLDLSSKPHGHVGVYVGVDCRRVQLDDGGKAAFAGGRGHTHVEPLQVQTPAGYSFSLK